MKRTTISLLAALMIGVPVIGGCDETLHEEKEVKQKRDGTVVTEHEKTTQSPDGTVKKTEEKTVDRP